MRLIGSALLSRANGSTPSFLCFILGVGVDVCILYFVPNVACSWIVHYCLHLRVSLAFISTIVQLYYRRKHEYMYPEKTIDLLLMANKLTK